MTPKIRAAVLQAYLPLAQSWSLDVAAELQAAGLPATALATPERKLPIRAVNRLFERAAAHSGVAAVGLRVSAGIDFARLGLIGLLALERKTVGEVIVAIASNVRLHNEALSMWVEPVGAQVAIHLEFLGRDRRPMPQMMEMAMGVTYRNFARVASGATADWRVHLRHPAPADTAEHRAVFGAGVQFDADMDVIVCTAADLRRPNAHYLADAGERMARLRASGDLPAAGDIVDLTQRLICALMPSGEATAEQVAVRLGINRRTLHRQLTARGESFMGLLTSLRIEYAMRHLASGERSVAAVAELLGFTSQSDFANWFRKHFGLSASAWRLMPRAPVAEG